QSTMINDLAADTAFRSIAFAGDGYTINGNDLALSNGISTSNATGVNTVNVSLTLTANQAFTSGVAGTNLILAGATVDNGGHTWTVNGPGDVYFAGNTVTGAGGLTKDGTG